MKVFAELPDGEVIISMASHGDKLVVATSKKVYSIDEGGLLTPILFSSESDCDIEFFDVVVIDEDGEILFSTKDAIKGNFTVNGIDPAFNGQGQAILNVGDVVLGEHVSFIASNPFDQ